MKNEVSYQYLKDNFRNIFVIADTHFGHENIIKFYPERGKTIDEHDNKLISNWNSVVTEDDIIIHLGDFAFRSSCMVQEYLEQLNGYKVLLLGNHDNLKIKGYSLFDNIFDVFRIRKYPLEEDFTSIIMCHYPFESWRNKSHGSIHLHGHVHGDNHHDPVFLTTKERGYRRLDVGVDSVGMTPITITKAVEMALANSQILNNENNTGN